jgi:hypothetical protein
MQQLPEILSALTEGLEQIRDGNYDGGEFNGSHLDRIEDEDFIYLEAALARVSNTEIDISIHEARAFIRIERSVPGPDSGNRVESDSNAIFGWVEFAEGGATFRAALDMTGAWECANAPDIALRLNDEFSPAGEPAELSSWCDILIKAANRLNGLAWLVPDTLSDE